MSGFFHTINSGIAEMIGAFTARRGELMSGSVDKLWEIRRETKRVYLCNVSRDISVQEAWFTTDDGRRQALGRVRPGERSEIRAYRNDSGADIAGKLEWKVRSMLLPGRSIARSEPIQDGASS